MSTPSPAPQGPLSAGAIRRILGSLEDPTQGHANAARAICDLFDDDGDRSLIPERTIQLMTHLAWQVWRSESRTWPAARWMETWMVQFLHAHPNTELDDEEYMLDQWTIATFLTRHGDDFSFIHSSLLEYFLAKRLADSLAAESEDEAHTAWDITRPSDECFAFFAELIDRLSAPTQRRVLARLEHVGTHASASARANVFAYTLHALEKDAPHPRPDALNLANTDLRGWTIGYKTTTLNLAGVSLRGARLDNAHIRHAHIDGADATGASMQRTLLEHCTLTQANLEEADLAGTIFRHCDMEGASLDKGKRYRTQLLHSTGYRLELSNVLTAPLTEHDRLRLLPEAQILGGHSDHVRRLTWSPDGTHILTGSGDGTARIWDTTTGDNTLTLTTNSDVEAVKWSPNGTHILTTSEDGTALIWDATTGNNTLTRTHRHGGWVVAAEWSPDGTRVVTGSGGAVSIWDATTGDNTLTLTTTSVIDAAAWSPDGTHVITGSGDGTARIWDTTSGNNTLTLATNSDIAAAAWSPDGTHVLTGSSDGTAHIWDTTTGNNTLTLTHEHAVLAVAWSPDGTYVITGSGAKVRIWDATTGDNTLTLKHTNWIGAVAWSPDGTHILSGSADRTVRIWDATTGDNTLTLTTNSEIAAVAWSPDGKHVLSGSGDGTARIWDATTGDDALTLTHTYWIGAVAWSPDGTHILTGSKDGTARIWESTTGEQAQFMIATLPEGEFAVLSADRTEVIGASPYAWRWLGRYAKHPDGSIERVPVEIDGPLPPLGHGGETALRIEG